LQCRWFDSTPGHHLPPAVTHLLKPALPRGLDGCAIRVNGDGNEAVAARLPQSEHPKLDRRPTIPYATRDADRMLAGHRMTDADRPPQPFPPATAAADREAARLAALARYDILDTPPEVQFDRIVTLARMLFDTPVALITLVDHDRQWFKAKSGIDDQEGPRTQSFCSQAMEGEGVFFVPDAQLDPRFADNMYVVGEPRIRFYAGAPLRSADGHSLGAVCVISPDARPEFSADDQRKLHVLASIVGNEMELRQRAQSAHKLMFDQDLALREAHYRIKNSLDYATLLAEINEAGMTTDQLVALAMTAWKHYSEAGAILNGSVKALRQKMPAQEYRDMLDAMPGFGM
jgi:hypothetical protein